MSAGFFFLYPKYFTTQGLNPFLLAVNYLTLWTLLKKVKIVTVEGLLGELIETEPLSQSILQ